MYFAAFVLKNLVRRPIRTALTVLGLAVAVGSMIALLGISHNVNRSVEQSFEDRGVDLIVMEEGKPQQTDSDIDQALVERVRRMDDVAAVDMALASYTDITRPKTGSTTGALCFGWPPENFGYEDLRVVSGRRLAAGDAHKVMLGVTLAQNLRTGVGDSIIIHEEPFEVVGTFESITVFENGAVVMLLTEAQRLNARPGKVSGFSLRVKRTDHPDETVAAVRDRIKELKDAEGKPARLSVLTVKDYVNSVLHLMILRGLVWMVSVIAVAIGVISMLNTMVMSVMERTQEIGILRAVGWPRGRVVRMVLGEAVVLGLAASVVGAVGAVGFTHLLASFPKVNGFIEGGIAPVVIAEGIGLTTLIGLFGGLYPAIRAARLLPTEAIRHD